MLTPGPEHYLKVFTLPGMQCTYSLAVSKYCTLAEVLPNQVGGIHLKYPLIIITMDRNTKVISRSMRDAEDTLIF